MSAETCNTSHGADQPIEPARLQSCQECPFRKTNQNRAHPRKYGPAQYGPEEFTRIWRTVAQDGDDFTCHLWDANLHYSDADTQAAGYHKPADVGHRIECAGMVAMVERELDIADASPTYTEYQQKRPLGLSKKAILRYSARRRGATGTELRFSEHASKADILDPHDVIDPASPYWLSARDTADALLHTIAAIMPSLRECDCKVCEQHTEIHPALELTTAEDLTVKVDTELHPLLSVLASAGIRTTDSCINLYEPLMDLTPEHYGPMTGRSRPGVMNYSSTLRRRAAFIRLRNAGRSEQAFIAKAEQVQEVEVTTSGALTQIVFPRNAIPALMEAAKA